MAPTAMAGNGDESGRDYAMLYMRLCDCAGPQPSLNNAREDEHRSDCPYRAEVEGDGNSG